MEQKETYSVRMLGTSKSSLIGIGKLSRKMMKTFGLSSSTQIIARIAVSLSQKCTRPPELHNLMARTSGSVPLMPDKKGTYPISIAFTKCPRSKSTAKIRQTQLSTLVRETQKALRTPSANMASKMDSFEQGK